MGVALFVLLALIVAGVIAYPLLPGRAPLSPAPAVTDDAIDSAVRKLCSGRARAGGAPACPVCGTAYQPGDRFCVRCGGSLPPGDQARSAPLPAQRTCPSCGAALHEGDRFCAGCGYTLHTEGAA
jgi:predicted nucleic acid-binding Zn ribbon protein